MLLDELVTAINNVKGLLSGVHKTILSQNEYRTRLALIDPILKALGWDVSNPELVTPEYPVEGKPNSKRVDYALLVKKEKTDDLTPKAFIEAKSLETDLEKTRHEVQVVNYARKEGIRYIGMTNGNRWIVEDYAAGFSGKDGKLLDVTLSEEETPKCALYFLLLWRSNLETGGPVNANEPLLVTPPDLSPPPEKPVVPQPLAPSYEGWIDLSDFQYDKNSMPSEIHLPDGQDNPINAWIGIFRETAEYLVRLGKLTEAVCPIGAIVNTKPESPSGTKWSKEHTSKLSNGLYFNRNVGGSDQVRRAKSLIKRFGEDPATILLKPN